MNDWNRFNMISHERPHKGCGFSGSAVDPASTASCGFSGNDEAFTYSACSLQRAAVPFQKQLHRYRFLRFSDLRHA